MGALLPSVFSLFLLLSLLSIQANNRNNCSCKEPDQCSISCIHDLLRFPLSKLTYPGPECGFWTGDFSDHDVQGIHNVYSFEITEGNAIFINETSISASHVCRFVDMFPKFPSPEMPANSTSLVDFSITPNVTFFNCSNSSYHALCFNYLAYRKQIQSDPSCLPNVVHVGLKTEHSNTSYQLSLLASGFTFQQNDSVPCSNKCDPGNKLADMKRRKKIILATVLSGGFLVMVGVLIIINWQRKRFKKLFLYRPFSTKSRTDLQIEGATSDYFGASVFTYEELEKATNNFDPSKELGDGGFGTVYHGKLSDGREVAVKKLYQHNYKRVVHFMNEVKILTGLRHPNLVTLYGCTSRQSRELLLVYEYISNGTVADHLHGDKAKQALLDWQTRLNIAIETAEALSYLHHINIIHRDVKTTNILLDSNFSVKVADFGLSRPLPNNVSHVSTAPQGTPGYVDPEYYQCYQLTDKSDVYSFGVVLVELISSMPAVDIYRRPHEINLASFAINRIQDCAFEGLIDPGLGYQMDHGVKRMTTCVAELAFQCLQNEKDFRPTMDEIVKNLEEIRGYKDVTRRG